MRAVGRLFVVVVWAAGAGSAGAAPGAREAHVGYLYPAGGRQGTSFQVTAGGQYLDGTGKVYVSGEGVRASLVWHVRPMSPLQLRELGIRIREVLQKRNLFPGKGAVAPKQPPADGKNDRIPLPDMPVLRDLEKKTPAELWKLAGLFRNLERRRRINPQLSEEMLLAVTVDAGAAPGTREVRFETPLGLSNPMRFQVGTLPEVLEQEPAPADEARRPRREMEQAPQPGAGQEAATPVPELPALLNGQIMPGDVDRFRITARKGQRLVVQTRARALLPYLADAVPGWFQATTALYDAKGREVAFADDYRFDPDPVLLYAVPADGEYQLEVRDSIYRGREDFVYRVQVGEQPFITRLFPLGGQASTATVASVAGWNLPEQRLELDTRPGTETVRLATLRGAGGASNQIPYAVDTLPNREETEPNDAVKSAQRVLLPLIVNGRVGRPGDVDQFRFEARAGQEVVVEVAARRLGSPLDSLVRLTDATGQVLAWNDDNVDRGSGLLTHHADSFLSARLPKDGAYFVQVSDSQSRGHDSFGYRLRIGPRQPDFALRVTPSGVNVSTIGTAPLTLYALRKDGFDGEIEIVLKDAPAGFRLSGGRIPRGCDSVRMTLTAPCERSDPPRALRLDGRARIGEATITRTAVPADDMMQAFAYWHMVPAQELLVAATRLGRRVPDVEMADSAPVRIPAGGSARVQVKAAWRWMLQNVALELSEPPKGMSLGEVTVLPDGLAFVVKAEAGAAKPGTADNLIVEAYLKNAGGGQGGKGAARGRRTSLGTLPAIPFEIVKK